MDKEEGEGQSGIGDSSSKVPFSSLVPSFIFFQPIIFVA